MALEPTRRLPPARAPFGTGELSGASESPLGAAPPFEAGAAAMRAKQAIKAQLFPEQIELAPHIGRFTILRELGRGGMGVVYMAYDETLDRRVAIKLLYESPDVDTEGQARLLREAQAMARLNHPNIAAVYEAGTHEGRVFIAMEFVQGKPLDVWLKERPRPWREVVGVFIQAGRGLHAAHCAGLVHRDFKPANVMLGSDGRVRVLDFGLARGTQVLEPDGELGTFSTMSVVMPMFGMNQATLTGDGTIVGTPAYMPPEQFRGQAIDPRADQYALCVSLYEALYRQLPFRGNTLSSLWTAVLAGPSRTPPRGASVPAWLHRLLLRGLDPDPAHRFISTAALLTALERGLSRRVRDSILKNLIIFFTATYFSIEYWPEARCYFAEDEISDIWDTHRKAELHAIFENHSPQAEDAWKLIEPQLDTITERWSTEKLFACKAYQGGKESEALYDRRRNCLSRFRRAFIATIDALAHQKGGAEWNAFDLVETLRRLPECAGSSAKDWPVDPPPLNKQEESIRLYGELDEYEVRLVLGVDLSLMEASQELVLSARVLAHPPLLAESLRQLAVIQQRLGFSGEGCESLRESFSVSGSIDYDFLAAENAKDIIRLCSPEFPLVSEIKD